MRRVPTYNNKCDIWGLGCILFEIVTEENLFVGDWEVMRFADYGTIDVPRGKLCEVQDVTVDAFLQSVRAMLSLAGSDRPPAHILQLSFQKLSEESRLVLDSESPSVGQDFPGIR